MSVNIVNKTTGELTKVAGNVAPPTDSITNGDMRPITSNAVYDYMNDSVSVAATDGETRAHLYTRLHALITASKLNIKTRLNYGGTYFEYAGTSSGAYYFKTYRVTPSNGNFHVYLSHLKIAAAEADCEYKQLDISTGAGSGSGDGLHWSVQNATSGTTNATMTLYYR